MNIIKNFISFIKNLFSKQNNVKELTESKSEINTVKNDKAQFIKSMNNSIPKKRVETPICEGDGLGIQHNITY